jgi:hypothetical protein
MADKYVPIFYDWIEATQELNAQEKGRLIDAIVVYARGGDWQEQIKGNERYVFPLFRGQVDRAKAISSLRASARTNNNKTEQNETKSNKRYNNNKNKNKNNNKNNNENNNESELAPARARFTPPTLEEVSAYAREKGWGPSVFNPERFVDYYASKGWKVGKDSPMRDWKAAARGWVARDKDKDKSTGAKNPALDYQQRDNDYYEHFFDNYDPFEKM